VDRKCPPCLKQGTKGWWWTWCCLSSSGGCLHLKQATRVLVVFKRLLWKSFLLDCLSRRNQRGGCQEMQSAINMTRSFPILIVLRKLSRCDDEAWKCLIVSRLEGTLPGGVECNKHDKKKLPHPCHIEKVELRQWKPLVMSKLEGRLPGSAERNKHDEEKLSCLCCIEKVPQATDATKRCRNLLITSKPVVTVLNF